jgi:pyridoxal phosphate-dependent aminotransferase EpsN
MNFVSAKRAGKRIMLSLPHMGDKEIRYVEDAFATNWLSTVGPNLSALEQEFSALVGLPSVALGSGTAAIHLGIKLLGFKPGDEMVTPTLTFAASCNPVLYEKGVPVFIDSDHATWNLNPQLLADFLQKRARINKLPKAVTVVHLFGQSADLDPILEICGHYELPVLEDAAECLGAVYKGRIPGTLGNVGVFSFNGNKVITCTGGGMLVSPREEWISKASFWSTQACDPDTSGVNNYLHSELGYNYRLSNVLAGIARGQLEVLELRVRQRRQVFERYRKAFEDLPGIEPQPEADFGGKAEILKTETLKSEMLKTEIEKEEYREEEHSTLNIQHSTSNKGLAANHVPSSVDCRPSTVDRRPPTGTCHTRWLSCFLIDPTKLGITAAELIRFLDAANVESRPVWKPMHTQKLYQSYECVGGQVAEDLNKRGICLPSSSSLTEEDQQFVIDRVREAAKAK